MIGCNVVLFGQKPAAKKVPLITTREKEGLESRGPENVEKAPLLSTNNYSKHNGKNQEVATSCDGEGGSTQQRIDVNSGATKETGGSFQTHFQECAQKN